jgi:hypothetical protein
MKIINDNMYIFTTNTAAPNKSAPLSAIEAGGGVEVDANGRCTWFKWINLRNYSFEPPSFYIQAFLDTVSMSTDQMSAIQIPTRVHHNAKTKNAAFSCPE